MTVASDRHRFQSIFDARAAVDGLSPLELRKPRIDRADVEAAIGEYLHSIGASPRPVRWFADARSARSHLDPRERRSRYWRAYWSDSTVKIAPSLNAAWHVGDAQSDPSRIDDLADFDCSCDPPFAPDPRIPTTTLLVSPGQPAMIPAFLAGLYYYAIGIREVVCIPRPSLWMVNGYLHREDGPAVEWPTGERYFFWHGVRVPDWVIEHPENITLFRIRVQSNATLRHCMIARFGIRRFLQKTRAKIIASDSYGKLWRAEVTWHEPYLAVQVNNGTGEPDGTRRSYFLCVPPWMQTAHEAVAWTYGLRPEQYDIAVRT